MNLCLFNKVNLKNTSENRTMYSEWTSLSPGIQNNLSEVSSVLGKLNAQIGKDVAVQVVKQLASNLGITQASEPSPLSLDKEVQWCMEVICYGLTLPLTDHDTIRDCVNIYCEWLSALDKSPKVSVPKPVCDDPNLYGRKIIIHFQNLFVPRRDEGTDATNKQAVLCHRVLRTVQHVAQESQILTRSTWDTILMFLVAVNDILLSPPISKDDVGDQLSERVLEVLFKVWILACARCFPAPPLWKTMREACMRWRHHPSLIEQWNRITLALTARLLTFMYGSTFPQVKISSEEQNLIPTEMSNDCIAQSWFRFLHCIGNPVNLCRPSVISQTDKFLQYAIGKDQAVDPSKHPCLNALPQIFYTAVRGFSALIDAFLGIGHTTVESSESSLKQWVKTREQDSSIRKRLVTSLSISSPSVSKGTPKSSLTSSTSSNPQTSINTSGPSSSLHSLSSVNSSCFFYDWRDSLATNRAKCNSILHLFGEWLFEASFVGTESQSDMNKSLDEMNKNIEDISLFESGRAEAMGTLCRVFCSKKANEEILTVYLARFYLALQYGLRPSRKKECGETMANILLNCSDLLWLDLDGVQVLIPSIITALEVVLPEKELKLNSNTISKVELRRASIHLLLSMLALPLHFSNLTIRELHQSNKYVSFVQLKPRLMNLMINALQAESDSYNTHMLLGGLLSSIQDAVHAENINAKDTQNTSNLPSDTTSTHSASSGVPIYHSLPDEVTSHDSEISHQLDSAHTLFVRTTYLVCHQLISLWKADLNVSLAALELLAGLSRVHIKESDAIECKRAVKWLCDYIIQQCWRPPQAHSKDLHSTIVAAFHCCATWLCAHGYLLQDKDCLHTALEVVELGVSGSKSIGKPGEPICMKDGKQLKPASMRVKESAEHLLSVIIEQVGYFPSECGAESISSLITEISLLRYGNSFPRNESELDLAIRQFRYFVIDNSTIIALFEKSLGNDQDPQPTITMVIRGPFGRNAWTMQLRHLPRHKSGSKYHALTSSRPVPMHEPPSLIQPDQSYFPATVERIPEMKPDFSMRSADQFLLNNEQNTFNQLLETQCSLEATFLKNDHVLDGLKECTPPSICHDFQTTRLFLSHFGFLSYDDPSQEEAAPTLITFNSSLPEFWSRLKALDRMSVRTCDTVHVFYVGDGQRTADEIISNVTHASNVSSSFLQFLTTLGWPVDVAHHSGWTGHVRTSWHSDTGEHNIRNPPDASQHGGSLYNGENQALYWADASSEVAFIVPSRCRIIDSDASASNSSSLKNWYETGESEDSSKQGLPEFIRRSSTSQSDSGRRKNINRLQLNTYNEAKIIIAWLESFEDHLCLPVDDLLPYMKTGNEGVTAPRSQDVLVIFLYELRSNLLKVRLKGPTGRMNLATPLVDGMVLSIKVAGPLVRQTALNMAKRRRLDCDTYQPPHVRRRLKIQEICNIYKDDMSAPELLASLFNIPDNK